MTVAELSGAVDGDDNVSGGDGDGADDADVVCGQSGRAQGGGGAVPPGPGRQ